MVEGGPSSIFVPIVKAGGGGRWGRIQPVSALPTTATSSVNSLPFSGAGQHTSHQKLAHILGRDR